MRNTTRNRFNIKTKTAFLCTTVPLVAASLLLFPAQVLAQSSFIYGVAQDGNLYAVNPTGTTNSATVVRSLTPQNGGQTNFYANGLAANNSKSLLYFFSGASAGNANAGNGQMYYYNPGLAAGPTLVGGLARPAGRYSNAAFYNDAYWSFLDDTDTLVRFTFDSTGTSITNVTQFADITGGLNSSLFFGGDIAIRQRDGMLYGFATDQTPNPDTFLFFSLNLAGTPTLGTLQANFSSSVVTKTAATGGYQLGFSADGNTLYGASQNGAAGNWQTINTTTGANFGNASVVTVNGSPFTAGGVAFLDLSDGLSPTPAPPGVVSGLIGIAMGGAQFGMMRFRKRHRSKKETSH